jgi:hypothetical protein
MTGKHERNLRLTAARQRALKLLASAPDGYIEAAMMAHGFHQSRVGRLGDQRLPRLHGPTRRKLPTSDVCHRRKPRSDPKVSDYQLVGYIPT